MKTIILSLVLAASFAQAEVTNVFAQPKKQPSQAQVKKQLAQEMAQEKAQAAQNIKQAQAIQAEQAKLVAKTQAQQAAQAKVNAPAGSASTSAAVINTQVAKMDTYTSSQEKALRIQLTGELATGEVSYKKESLNYSGYEIKTQVQKDLNPNFFAQAELNYASTTAEFLNGAPLAKSPNRIGFGDMVFAGIAHKQYDTYSAFGGAGFGISSDTDYDTTSIESNNKTGGNTIHLMAGAERALANGNTVKGEFHRTAWQDRNITIGSDKFNVTGGDKTEYTATLTRPTIGQTAYGASVKYINYASVDAKSGGLDAGSVDQNSEWQLTAFAQTKLNQTPVKPFFTLVSKNGENYGDNSYFKLGLQANWQY